MKECNLNILENGTRFHDPINSFLQIMLKPRAGKDAAKQARSNDLDGKQLGNMQQKLISTLESIPEK